MATTLMLGRAGEGWTSGKLCAERGENNSPSPPSPTTLRGRTYVREGGHSAGSSMSRSLIENSGRSSGAEGDNSQAERGGQIPLKKATTLRLATTLINSRQLSTTLGLAGERAGAGDRAKMSEISSI